MAYKFQRGTAILSGAIEVSAEDAELAVAEADGTKVFEVSQSGNLSGSGNANIGTIQIKSTNFVDANRNISAGTVSGTQLSGSGNLLAGGTVRFDGVAQAAVAVAADSILFVDADDNLVKKEGVGAFATDLAGTGLEQDSNTIRIAAAAAGDGLTGGAGSALAVAVSGAIHVSGDKVSLTGSLAGDCLDKGAGDGVDSIRSLNVVADESTIESAGLSALRLKDDGVTGAKLAPAVAGAGLGQDGSGNLDIGAATNGGISVNTNDIGLDLNDLSAASVAVASDSIAIIDADDSNNTKKESIADLVAAMAGAGLAASAGVLSTQAGTVTQVTASSTALFEGYNYYTASASKSLTLPASPSVGDVVYLKVEDLGDGNALTVNRAGAHLIDGETSVALESDYAAVGFVYLVANKWGII